MSLARVQTAPPVTSGGRIRFLNVPFTTPPVVGNGLVVPVITFDNAAPTCTDNHGNLYARAVQRTNGNMTLAVFFCDRVQATGAPFLVTISGPNDAFYLVTAIEVSGVGYGLWTDQVASNQGTGTAPATGPTPALTDPDLFVVGVLELGTSQTFITVESVTPPWTQDAESLSFSIVAGEIDSRLLPGAAGAPTSIAWATSPSTSWVAVLATFRAQPGPTAHRATQLALETYVATPARLRTSQLALEVFLPQPIATHTTQVALEVYQAQAAALRLTQHLLELWTVLITEPCISGAFPIDPDRSPSRRRRSTP